MRWGLLLAVWSSILFSTDAAATWYSTYVCRTGSVSTPDSTTSSTTCWSEAYWVDDGAGLIDISPVVVGSAPGVDYWHYDSDGDGRTDCWKDSTQSATNNSPYGYSPWRAGNFHYGMDIGSALTNYGRGAPVRAIASGRVSETGSNSSNGNFIRVVHTDGRESSYLHLLSIDVPVGAFVGPGYQVGTMNCTGSCTSSTYGQNHVAGTHLHLEIRAYPGAPRDPQNTVDPAEYMSQCD